MDIYQGSGAGAAEMRGRKKIKKGIFYINIVSFDLIKLSLLNASIPVVLQLIQQDLCWQKIFIN